MADTPAYKKHEDKWWRDKLDGKDVPIHIDTPMRGFYAYRQGKGKPFHPVAFWYDGQGGLRCKIGDKAVSYGLEIWPGALRNPIEYDVYTDAMAGKPWPNEVRFDTSEGLVSTHTGKPVDNGDDKSGSGIGHNVGEGADTFTTLKGNILEWIEQGKRMMKKGPPENADEADALSDLATKLHEMKEKADTERKKEGAPLYEEWKQINAKWNAFIDPATTTVSDMKAKVHVWQVAERKRREAEAAAAAEELRQRAAAAAGKPDATPEELGVTVTVQPVRSGTRGRTISTFKKRVVEFEDIKKAAMFFLSMENPPADVVEAITKRTYQVLSAGVDVPGASLKTVDTPR